MLNPQSRAFYGRVVHLSAAFLLIVACVGLLYADASPFDLVGPAIDVKVNRDGKSLPIASVPNLKPGDRLWVHAGFPDNQSAHYVMTVTFLQGTTNPPPEEWFTRIETWNRGVREEGAFVFVPEHAQEALVFLFPDVSGAFGTLRSTVRGKPGIFVRAAHDLEQASLDRTRIDKFLSEIKDGSSVDPTPLPKRVELLSRSLGVKADADCFKKPVEEQSSCLTQDTDRLVLEDAQNQSMVATLTSGPSADLVGALSTAPVARGGYYSPYVGSALDIARLLNTFHSADLRYLPAMTLPRDETLDLRLNSPPSFQKPESVLVVALPVVAKPTLPKLTPVEPKQVFCLQNPSLVLPAEGAPLVFSTALGHDFVLHLESKSGVKAELPARADAAHGGFTVDTRKLNLKPTNEDLTGTLRGAWGFDAFEGPSFEFRNALPAKWVVPSADASAFVVGRKQTLHLQSGCAACVEKISAQSTEGHELKAEWKAVHADELEVGLNLTDESAGPVKLLVKQYSLAAADVISVRAYSEAAHLRHFQLHAEDREGVLTGTHLEQVDAFEVGGVHFAPAKLIHGEHEDTLGLAAPKDASLAALLPEEKVVAHVKLKDGRELELQTTVEPPRPSVTLAGKTVKHATSSDVRLGNPDELPQDGQLTFLLKARVPDKFGRTEQIEVATADEGFNTTLTFANGNLILQDSETALAVLDPLKNLGAAAFGPIQFRAMDDSGAKGDWQPLAKLVRIPTLTEIHCPESEDKMCTLSGSNLFLLDGVAADRAFKNSVSVPVGYSDTTIQVPRPVGALLYFKLRDDPSAVNTVALPVLPEAD